MKAEYLEQFSNQNIKKFLLSEEKFMLLEKVLAEEKAELRDIEKQMQGLDFGKPLNKTQIQEQLGIIAKEVNKFLGVNNIELPKLKAFTIELSGFAA